MNKNAFRQVCDKPCANKIIQAEWSPLRDLIAVLTSNGDIRLHRLYWQKVWVIPSKDCHPTCLSWNSDGSILAVGYADGTVSLYQIEKATVIHTFTCESKIVKLKWFSLKKTDAGTTYKDFSDDFYPDVDKEDLHKKLEKINLLICHDNYSVLVVGTSDGKVQLYVDGVFPLVQITANHFDKYLNTVSDVVCSHLDLKIGQLSVIVTGSKENEQSNSFYLFKFDSSLFGSRGGELSLMSVKFTKISNLLHHCEKVLKQMANAAEDIYLKINTKLEKLENLIQGTGSSVAAEFTIAYATGNSSAELQTFLTQHLTTKGLKQIAQSVQAGYSSLHNDVKDELELLATQLLFLFVELNGMARWFERFAILGLSADAVRKCITLLVQFIMKGQELLKVISDDMINFKVFFNWLAGLVFEMSGEQTQHLGNQMSNDDFDVMLDFLEYRLKKVDKTDTNGYDLERVSQFLREGSLEFPAIHPDNDWYQFIETHNVLRNHPSIVKPDTKATLLEIFLQLKKGTQVIFDSICSTMTDSFTLTQATNLFKQAENHKEECESLFSFHSKSPSLTLSILPCSCDAESFFMLDLTDSKEVKILSLSINPFSKEESLNTSLDTERYVFTLRDMRFYNDDFITLLYDEEDKTEDRLTSIFGQIPMKSIQNKEYISLPSNTTVGLLDKEDISIPALNVASLFSEQKHMESFRGKRLVVNGYSREVSCVISMSCRRVRVFDMTAEDDDPDDSKLDESSKLEATDVEDTKRDNDQNDQ